MHCVVGVLVGVRSAFSWGAGGVQHYFSFSHPVAKLEYIGITVSLCPDLVLTISCKPLDVL